ncbi:MAG: ATP-binding protein [Pseudomonadota bacterium]
MSKSKQKKIAIDNDKLLNVIGNQKLQIKKLKDNYEAKIHTLNFILQNLPASVYWKNREGVYLENNEYAKKNLHMLGFTSIVNGKTDYDIFSKEVADSFRSVDLTVLSGECVVTEEATILTNGVKFIQLSSKIPLQDKHKKIIGILGISIDITQRKMAEEALKLAKEKAEVANDAKTEFLENMRHDIRTPLSGIVGCAQLIQMQVGNAKKVSEYAEDLIQSSDALLDFLNKILESIQIDTGKIPFLKKKFDLYQLLKQVIHLNQPKAITKSLDLSWHYDKTIPVYLMGDPVRVQRIILELVTNALKFTDKGEIKITARLVQNKTRTGQMIIKLSVSDTGIGIPLDEQNEVYTRFKRLTPSYRGIYPGAGLGLSVVKQFIDDLNGEIYLDSKPNQGSIFTCLIPFHKSLLTVENELEKAHSYEMDVCAVDKKAENIAILQGERIAIESRVLVVEDNLIAEKIAQVVMSKLNCEIDIAGDGKTALAYIKKKPYDLILMDIDLPDNDSCEVIRRIRLNQCKRNPLIPIIGLTAYISTDKKRNCLIAGMNTIYKKPLTSDKAVQILNAFIPSQQQISPTSVLKRIDCLYGIPILDRDRGLELMGSKELLKEGLVLLVSGLAKEMEALKQHYRDKDWMAIGAFAHKWKGGASYCGARRFEQVCQELVIALQSKLFEEAEEFYQQLFKVTEATKAAAMQVVNSE